MFHSPYESVLETFRSKKVLTIDQLVELLTCSVITVRRLLKKWKAYTSINRNARYYVLPDIPQFDLKGLWQYEEIFFSCHGNLKQTVIHLIKNSDSGLTTGEIQKLVGLSQNNSFLSYFRRVIGIRRQKRAGRYIYFADHPEVYERQRKKRLMLQSRTGFPSDAEAVIILVERIKNPALTLEELAVKVAERGVKGGESMIRSFLEHHGLLKKT